MKKTVVLNVVGLTHELIGEHTPFLAEWVKKGKLTYIKPPLPALTCPAQTCYVTGKWPNEHGIVSNGWYFHDLCEIRWWQQSNKLVKPPKIWDAAKKLDSSFTCNNYFWWYNMYTTADVTITPRPIYKADGRKLLDCYTYPAHLRDELQEKLGWFPLFNFWGPAANIQSTRWIAKAAKLTEKKSPATLTLIYLPHLDYELQRSGIDFSIIAKDLREIDEVCADLIKFYEERGAQVIVLSEYGITSVNNAITLNRVLRKHGYISVREERGHEVLDAGASRAFAMADHQVAHIYVNDKSKLSAIRTLIENTPGVQEVWGEEEKKQHHLDHPHSGDLVAIADENSWFSYHYWFDDAKAPDFATIVEVFRKPGYDPLELFYDPKIKFRKLKFIFKFLKMKLGFRTLFNFIPFDNSLVKGSHGRYPDDVKKGPLIISQQKELIPDKTVDAVDVYTIMMDHLQNQR